MQDKITSHNQSGGITAKNVNVAPSGGGEAPKLVTLAQSPAKSTRLWTFWNIILGAVALVAGVVAILEYLKISPW